MRMKFEELAEKTISLARGKGVRFAEVRLERCSRAAIRVQDGRAESLSAGISSGAGVRVLSGGTWGFASTEKLTARSLEKALDQAIGLAVAAGRATRDGADVGAVKPVRAFERSEAREPLDLLDPAEKVKIALSLEEAGRKAGGARIVNSLLRLSDLDSREVIANTAGTLVAREDARVSAYAQYFGRRDELLQSALQVAAMRGGAELYRLLTPESLSLKAVAKVERLLASAPPPSGRFPVVFHPSITGLLVHEALGHNAEADHVQTGQSVLAGKLGQKIAPDFVTIADDPAWPASYGSYAYDSEGTPARRKTIIERGRLADLMHSLETAAHFGVEPNGSARAEDYSSRPIIRMSNTYLERGQTPVEELFRKAGRGVYLEDGHWGYVFVDKGQFTCHAGAARWIEDGKPGEPLRDVSISGMIFDALRDIVAVGDDFEMEMPGHCGKSDQAMYINAGGPHVLVADMVVGGEKED